MTNWKIIIGAKIEENYFKENVGEAKQLSWSLKKIIRTLNINTV
jgi:hypothetical protein